MAQSRAERLAGPVCCREAARSVASEGQAEAEQAAHGGALAGLSHNDFLCACHLPRVWRNGACTARMPLRWRAWPMGSAIEHPNVAE